MALVWSVMAAACLAIGQQGGEGSAKVAIVNIPEVSERYQKTADLEAMFEQRRKQLNEQRDAMQQQMEKTKRSLEEELKPGTGEFEQRRKQLAMQEAELQWFAESEGQKIEMALAGSLRVIYDDIAAVVREVAEERGIDIVLAADQMPPAAPTTTQQVRQQIVLQKVLYWHPRVDLTEAVVARVNARHAATKTPKP